MRRLLDRIACSACIGMMAAALLIDQAARAEGLPTDGRVEAVWRAQNIELNYRSEGRLYSCDVLEHKIRMILRRLGARDDLQLRRDRCHDLAGLARFEALLQSPVEATADNIRDITSHDSEEELVARLRGVQLPSPADVQRFSATWEFISFRGDGKLYLDAGDCALVQQLRRQVLPKMSVQVTKDIAGIDCSQELTGIAGPRLTVLALVPATAP